MVSKAKEQLDMNGRKSDINYGSLQKKRIMNNTYSPCPNK
jgi:hypothetical protein